MTAAEPPGRTGASGGWSLRRRVGVTFGALAAVLLLLLSVVVVALVAVAHSANDVVDRWEPAVSTSENLLADLVNQETGVRGYALSRRTEFLQPFSTYSAQAQTDTAALQRYLAGHDALLSALGGVEQAAATWRAQTALPLIALVQAGDPTAAIRVDSVADKARFDLIRQRSATLTAAVEAQNQRALNGRRTAFIYLIAAVVVAAVVIIGAAVAIWRGLHRWVLGPVDRLADQTRQVTAGTPESRIVPSGPPELVALGSDVETMRQSSALMLARVESARAELARSNADLEQFAYVASHDLSEPLRKVANFCQLLERQYGPQLDDTAREYIGFAVDGAKRMQTLIADLLALSRVGRTTESFQPVDTGAALERALRTLQEPIAASGARITSHGLPTVPGDPTLLTALFENLVGNAVKYRRAEVAPVVEVVAERDRAARMWTFTISDNGIGVDPQYADRIFVIFQRLHLRDQYGGTGIGLALCRKIVEFHGGRIWLDRPESPPGATFRFTLSEGPAQ